MSFVIESNRDEMKRNKKESCKKNVFAEANIFINRSLIKILFMKSNKSNRYIDWFRTFLESSSNPKQKLFS